MLIEAPSWAKEVLEYEIAHEEQFVDYRLYELVLNKSYGRDKFPFESTSEYIEIVEGEKHIRTTAILSEVRGQSIDQIQEMWKSKESKSLLIDRAWRVADWAGLLASIILLVLSAIYFSDWANKRKTIGYFAFGLLIQAAIFSTIFLFSMWDHFLVTFLAFLIPGIWFYELCILCNLYYRSKKQLTKPSS